jgi:hypothetical protein
MTRINVTRSDFDAPADLPNKTGLEGWFDLDDVLENVECLIEWDGNNNTATHCGRWNFERLYLTKGGRWVIRYSTIMNSDNNPPYYVFVSVDTAKSWLLLNEHDEVAERRIGKVEDESGPTPDARTIVDAL